MTRSAAAAILVALRAAAPAAAQKIVRSEVQALDWTVWRPAPQRH